MLVRLSDACGIVAIARVKLVVEVVAPFASVTEIVTAELPEIVGVPEITPVDVFSDRPAGREPPLIA